jgi:hypothetical protein
VTHLVYFVVGVSFPSYKSHGLKVCYICHLLLIVACL